MNLSTHLLMPHPHKWSLEVAKEMESQRQIIKKVCMNKNILLQSKILLLKGIKQTLKSKLNQVSEQAHRFSIKRTENETLKYFPSDDPYIVISDKCLRQVHTIQKNSMMKLQELISKKNSIRKSKKKSIKSTMKGVQTNTNFSTVIIPDTKMISSIILDQSINDETTNQPFHSAHFINSIKVSKNNSKAHHSLICKDQQLLKLHSVVKEIRSIRSKNIYLIKILKHGRKNQEELMIWFRFHLPCLEQEINKKAKILEYIGDSQRSSQQKESATTSSPNQKQNWSNQEHNQFQQNKASKQSSVRRKNLLQSDNSQIFANNHQSCSGSYKISDNMSQMIANIPPYKTRMSQDNNVEDVAEEIEFTLQEQLVQSNCSRQSSFYNNTNLEPRGGREMSLPNHSSRSSIANCSQLFSNNFYNHPQQHSQSNNDSQCYNEVYQSSAYSNEMKSNTNNKMNDGSESQNVEGLQLWEIRLNQRNQAKKSQKLKQLSQSKENDKYNQQLASTSLTNTANYHNFSKKLINHDQIETSNKLSHIFSSSTNNNVPPSQHPHIQPQTNNSQQNIFSFKSMRSKFLNKINSESNKENTPLNKNVEFHQFNLQHQQDIKSPNEKSNPFLSSCGNIFSGEVKITQEQNIFTKKDNYSSSNPFAKIGSNQFNQHNTFSSNSFSTNPFSGTTLPNSKSFQNCFTQKIVQTSNTSSNKMSNNLFNNAFKPSNYFTTSQDNIFSSSNNIKFSSMNRIKTIFE